ncbi:BEL1-like homeodomain protein 9 [Striga hermonthica]|uniref:BEL1-like homeodomain protein 9 n=1 Tax=Striga hermonthica TaxID=68872 RepID=A0A9N7RH67_STRHE|nr:BEL1-like homeodomain protein 9 [Striga hermonthica]
MAEGFEQYHNPNATGQSLSLTLSSSHGGDLNLPPELNLQKYDFGPCRPGFGPIEFSKSTVPLGPFTGYAFVLKGSRFLRPAQQLLEELCDMGRVVCLDKIGPDPGLLDPPPLDNLTGVGIMDDSSDGGEQKKKSRLLSMLDEVYKRYKQYYQQMQAAIAAFESVAGLSNAAPFANLALKSMSKHFKCLKNAITDQLQFSSKSHGKTNSDRNETQRLESSGKGSYGLQRPFGAGFMDPPVWRPQRGLPEHAVTVLRSWLFEHFLHPYPTDTDKVMLAKQTGLSRNQVSNWFINARVRLWKPMVEEIHTLETRQQAQNSSEQSPNNSSNRPVEHENRSKRNREDKTETQRPNHGPIKSPYDNLLSNNNKNYNNNNKSNNHQLHVGIGSSGGNSGVSLTLGLHQNGPALPDSYPIHAARRLGLDSQTGDEYVVSGFTAQDSRFRREVMDGQQIMHDFVG